MKRVLMTCAALALPPFSGLASSAAAEAAKRGTAEQVQRLIDSESVDPNARPPEVRGMTPLHVAVANGKADVVKVLLDNWASVNVRDDDGETPLHWAAVLSETPGVIEALLAGGADLHARNSLDETPCDVDERGHLAQLGVC